MAKYSFKNMLKAVQDKEASKQKKIEWLNDELVPHVDFGYAPGEAWALSPSSIPKSTAAKMAEQYEHQKKLHALHKQHKKELEQMMLYGSKQPANHSDHCGTHINAVWQHHPAQSLSAYTYSTNYTQVYPASAGMAFMTREKAIALNNGEAA